MRARVLLMMVVVLRSVLVLARFVVMLVGFHAVGQPDALDRRENHPIEDTRRRLEHADHGIGMLAVLGAARSEAVTADEAVAHAKPGPGRDERAERRFERRLPQPAPGQLAAIMLGIRMLGADDAKARQTVAQRQRNGFRDKRVLRPALGVGKRDVPRRKIDVIDAGQDELQGAALAADHQVDATGVPGQAVLELRTEEQQQHDHGNAERQQRQIERGVERPGANVGEAEAEQAHGWAGSSRRCPKCGLRRASWVAMTSVAPDASAWARSSASTALAVRVVERGGRLVSQDQRRVIDHGTRDRDPLRLTLAEPARARPGQSAEAEVRDQGIDPRRILRQAGEGAGEPQVVAHGQRRNEMQALQHDPDRPAAKGVQLGRRQRRQILPRHQDAAAARAQQTGDQMQQGALAGARWPEDQAVLAGGDRP